MPELPEVETVRRGLAGLAGASVSSVLVLRDSAVRHHPHPAEFAAQLEGAVLGMPARRGKFLWFPLDDATGAGQGTTAADPGASSIGRGAPAVPAPHALSAHLGMSGQFRVFSQAAEPHRHCRVRLTLDGPDGELTLDFLDQRTFGYLRVEPFVSDAAPSPADAHGALVPASVAHIGRDALDPLVDASGAALRRGRRAIKQVLLDQAVVSGIGNIYADEALWLAGIHPATPASALTAAQASGLMAAVASVMEQALAQGGTSFDALYVNVNGESGYFSRELRAYAKTGQPCGRCASPIERAVLGGRSTHWCPVCQPTWDRARD